MLKPLGSGSQAKAAAAIEDAVLLFSVDLQAPVIIIPQDCSSVDGPCLFADLGHLAIKGGTRNLQPPTLEPSADSLIRDNWRGNAFKAYCTDLPFSDTIAVKLTGLQVLLTNKGLCADKGRELDEERQSSSDANRLLRRFDVALVVDMASSPAATKMAIDVRTTPINVVASTAQLQQLINFNPHLGQELGDAISGNGAGEYSRDVVREMMFKALKVSPEHHA